MGTRADFYIGRGKQAKWLGSVGMDGYQNGGPKSLLTCKTEEAFSTKVNDVIESVSHGTKPEQGWPWPWRNSRTTDYSYAFDEGKVWVSVYGHGWHEATIDETDDWLEDDEVDFPDMSSVQKVTRGIRSGLLIHGNEE